MLEQNLIAYFYHMFTLVMTTTKNIQFGAMTSYAAGFDVCVFKAFVYLRKLKIRHSKYNHILPLSLITMAFVGPMTSFLINRQCLNIFNDNSFVTIDFKTPVSSLRELLPTQNCQLQKQNSPSVRNESGCLNNGRGYQGSYTGPTTVKYTKNIELFWQCKLFHQIKIRLTWDLVVMSVSHIYFKLH
jgi:hypothetical protein